MGESIKMNNEMAQFLSSHFQSFATHHQALGNQIDQADATLRNAIAKLAKTVENEIDKMNHLVVEMQPKLEAAYQRSLDSLNTTAQSDIKNISESFEKSKDKLNQLDHLERIEHNMARSVQMISELSKSGYELEKKGNSTNEENSQNVNGRPQIEKDIEQVLKLLTYSTISGIGIYFLVKWIYSVFISLFVTF